MKKTPKNIVIVDDESHVVETIKLVLRDPDYLLKTASTADEALKFIDRETDLVLLDIRMPGMRPIELIGAVRVRGFSKIKFIYVTAVELTEEQKKKMCKEKEIVDFILKPFDSKDLRRRVRKALAE